MADLSPSIKETRSTSVNVGFKGFTYAPVYIAGISAIPETDPNTNNDCSGDARANSVVDLSLCSTDISVKNHKPLNLWTDDTPIQHPPNFPRGNPWRRLRKITRKYDDEMCQGWNDDADTMLVFAGLFSAAVTAFCVEAFERLAPDPNEATNALLYHVSQQLANASLPSAADPMETASSYIPESCRIQVNILYFVSLTLALSVAFLCILCKQWLREYQRDLSISHRDAVRLRQLRFEGLNAWYLPEILASLPVLLQIALIFFFCGLLIQTWHTHYTVAALLTVVIGSTFLVVLLTTIAPAHFTRVASPLQFSPFRSPQSQLYYRLVYSIRKYWDDEALPSWKEFDLSRLKQEFRCSDVTSIHRSLLWIRRHLGDTIRIRCLLFWCMQEPYTDPNMQPDLKLAAHVMEAPTNTQAYSKLLCEENLSGDLLQGQDTLPLRIELLLRESFTCSPSLYAHEAILRSDFDTCVRLLGIVGAKEDAATTIQSAQDEGLADQIAMLLERMLLAQRRLSPPDLPTSHLPSLDIAILVASIFIIPTNSPRAHRIWDAALRP